MVTDGNDSGDGGTISIELGVSRRKLMKQLSAVGLAAGSAGLAGCTSSLRKDQPTKTPQQSQGSGSGGTKDSLPSALRVPLTPPPTADSMDLSNPKDEQRNMVFVTHVVNEFFQPAIAGMNDGLHRNGWKGQFIGPSSHDPAKQVEMLRTTISRLKSGRDVIATTVLDREQYKRPLKEAANKNIPVVGYNTSVYAGEYNEMMKNFGNYIPYVGQEFVSAGVAAGLTAYERAQKQLGKDEKLVVQPAIIVPGHPALQGRVNGIRQALEAQENTKVLETLDTSTDLSKAISRVQDAYSANPDMNVILGTGDVDTAAGGRLVEDKGLKGEMIVGGFDLPEATRSGIKKGTIEFTAGQDPYSQGFMSTQLAWGYMERGVPMKDYNTGITVIDESNIEFAEKRDGAIPQLQNWQKKNYSV